MRSATSSPSVSVSSYAETDFGDRAAEFCRSVSAHRQRGAQFCAALAIYSALAVSFFGRSLFGAFGSRYVGRETDQTVMMWLFRWWPYAIAHHVNVFLTHLVWAPVGFNLASMTSIPLLAFIAYPFTRTLGLVAAYNILALMAPTTAALCAYALCRQITGKFWPSLLGGYLFGFSGYMLGELLGHLNLVTVFALPLAACLAVARLQGKLRRMSFAGLLTLTLVAQFLINMEFFATGLLFGAVTLAAIIFYSPATERYRYYAEVPAICASLVAATIVVSPYIYYFLAYPRLHQPFWPAEHYSTDLLNFLIATPANLFGTSRWTQSISSHFPGRLMEQGGYVALPIFVMVILWARGNWHQPLRKAIVAVLFAGCVATLGPWLHIGGAAKSVLPWLAFVRMPLLEHILPARLMVVVSLLLAVIVALWMAEAEVAPKAKIAAALLTVAMMLPNPSAAFWSSPVDNPQFFTNNDYSKYLSRHDVVLTLPWGQLGSSMLWQAECGMCFRNVGGSTGTQRFAVRRWPIIDYFLGAYDLEDVDLQFKAFLANNDVSLVLVEDASVDAARWNALAQSLRVPRIQVSGVSLYRIPPTLLASYRAMSGLEVESRATSVRFDMTVRAAGRYLASGYDPRELTVNRLIELSLLPARWNRGHRNDTLVDLFVMQMGSDRFAIAEYGSYSALRGVIDAYRMDASAIFYPFPELLWEPHPPSVPIRLIRKVLTPAASGPVDGESMQVLAIEFTRAQLRRIAASVANAPEERKPAL